MAFASFAAPAMAGRLGPTDFPAYLDLRLNWRMLAFAAALCGSAVLLFAMLPAWSASGAAPLLALNRGGRYSGRMAALKPMLAAQAGFSFAVLFLCGLLLLSYERIASIDLGFGKSGVILFNVRPPKSTAADAVALLDHVRSLPGVRSASLSSWGLVAGPFAPVWIPLLRLPGHDWEQGPRYLGASPGFFETMQIRFLEGRDLTWRDAPPGGQGVVVNETFVRRYFPEGSSIGRRFDQMIGQAGETSIREIVGVVQDAKYNDLREGPAPTVYVPMTDASGTLEARVAGDAAKVLPVLRREIASRTRVTGAMLQSTQIDNTLLRERLLAMVSAFFAVVAMVLAAVGLYGVLRYTVVRRTREIGVRVALGATGGDVTRSILRDIAPMVLIGVAAGWAGGRALSRWFSGVLYGIKGSDLTAAILPLLLITAVLAMAALGPVRRAAGIDPAEALRCE
jgi:predicted permease